MKSEPARRLETAMVTGRRWRPTAFHTLVLNDPNLAALARELVWATFTDTNTTDESAEGAAWAAAAAGTNATAASTGATVRTTAARPGGTPRTNAANSDIVVAAGSFRVEDGSGELVDVRAECFELREDALVGVAHPLHLGESLRRWRRVFGGLGVRQPFEQLHREVHRFTAAEAKADRLRRFENRRIPTGRLYTMQRQGWELGHDAISLPVGVRRRVRVGLDPGIRGGYRYEAEEQRIVAVTIEGGEFGALDAVTASELLRQLARPAALAPARRPKNDPAPS
ncbi:DUF4132 domain-containing protein [Nocardia yamanashiensis]|uniref:DUF4132 domain-containing protein n=1 Tax=Nocardia yamanashiensis TaxID=209247 RepID=UPI000A00C315|nr:DUF4132 domain-containing protein [Nocardia yamanashiensis]